MTSSFQVRISILPREVETSFEFKWTRRKLVNLTILGQFVNKPLIKLLLAYSFQKCFSLVKIQNTFTWHIWNFSGTFDLLLFNSRYLVFEVYSHHTKEILHINTNFIGNESWSKNTFSLASDPDVEKTCFLM